jgi:predicted RNA-binding protein YlxR (DUF448 family)
MKKTFDRASSKRAPQRTCVACRRVGDKRGLVRLVRTGAGVVEVDPSGKKAGRGAYLCRAPGCWEAGIMRGKLEHALRQTLTPGDKEALARLGQDLIEENAGG